MALTLERPTLLRQALVLIWIGFTCLCGFRRSCSSRSTRRRLALKLVLDLRAPGGREASATCSASSGATSRRPRSCSSSAAATSRSSCSGRSDRGRAAALRRRGEVEYDVTSAIEWILDHFAELSFSVAVIPVSRADRPARARASRRATTPAERPSSPSPPRRSCSSSSRSGSTPRASP